jgi:hypothetical protein
MRMRLMAGLLLFGVASLRTIAAQGVDPNLTREVAAVRAEVARSNLALRQYTWREHTEVLVKGDVKSSDALTCRFDRSGELIKTPISAEEEKRAPSGTSKRPMVRKKADMQDYIERAVSRIHKYVPPKPEQIQYLLENGFASLGQSEAGKSELRFTNYFERGDSLVFTYDSASKTLLRANIASTLGNPKDPVTLEVAFESLPDGVNHVASATLNAPSRKVQVKTRNVMYQKLEN